MSNENVKDPELEKILAKKANELAKKASMLGRLIELNRGNFDEFIKSFKVTVVDFWAPWCAPCFMLEPILKKLAADLANYGVGFGRVNADEEPEIAARYYVMSLPTVIIFKEGDPVDEVIGVAPRKVFESKIMRVLNS